MIRDVVLLRQVLEKSNALGARASVAFIGAVEKRLGGMFVRDARSFPFERPDLNDLFLIAETLQKNGIIKSLRQLHRPADEPRLFQWFATGSKDFVGGASTRSDADALVAALAEGLERYLWWEADDYFHSPIRATTEAMARWGKPYAAPTRFASFTNEQRASDPTLTISDRSSFLWIRGHSLISKKETYLPAQCVSGIPRSQLGPKEPLIRLPITTGLATWKDQQGARLRGALEVIERDAYMITWLNKLTPPRISLINACARSASLQRLVAMCERYGFVVHALRLITDAPTYAVCAVIEDAKGHRPHWAVGLKAHFSLPHAIEEAIIEALRARIGSRKYFGNNEWDDATPQEQIGHMERLYFWGSEANVPKLRFLIEGEVAVTRAEPWDDDAEATHLERIVDWCRSSGYECVSVPLDISKKNPTAWKVEMVVIPELQPTYLSEKHRQLGGTRWREIPSQFGYETRKEPYIEPHPFA